MRQAWAGVKRCETGIGMCGAGVRQVWDRYGTHVGHVWAGMEQM